MLCYIALLGLRVNVNYAEPVTSLSRALAVISKQVGERYYTTPELGSQIVALKCNVTPETLRDRIAHVVKATWSKTSDGWRLERSRELAAALIQGDVATRASLMGRAVEFALSRCPPTLPVDQYLADFQVALETAEKGETLNREVRLRLRGLTDGLRRSLCEIFSPEELAAFPVGVRLIFSDKPTAKQRQLSESAKRTLDKALEPYRLFISKLPADWLRRWQASERKPDMQRLLPLAVDPRIGKVNIAVTTRLSSVMVEGFAYTRGGAEFAYSLSFMDVNRATGISRDPELWPRLDAVAPFANLIEFINDYDEVEPDPRAFRSLFSDMEIQDPLEAVATPILSGMAAYKKVNNYIAIVDDRWLEAATDAQHRSVNVQLLMSLFRAQGGGATVAEDWLEVAAPTPSLLSMASLNRAAMKKYWPGLKGPGRLRALSYYYFAADPAEFLLHSPFMASCLADGPRGDDFGLRILGSFDPNTWKSFFSGNRIPLNQVRNETRSLIELVANESDTVFGIDESIEDEWPDQRRSASEAFPHGFPSQAFLFREPDSPYQVIRLTPLAGENLDWRAFGDEDESGVGKQETEEDESPEYRFYPVMSDLVDRVGKKAPAALLTATFDFGVCSPANLVIEFLPGVTFIAAIEDDPVVTSTKVTFRQLAPDVQKLMKEMVKGLLEDEEVPKN